MRYKFEIIDVDFMVGGEMKTSNAYYKPVGTGDSHVLLCHSSDDNKSICLLNIYSPLVQLEACDVDGHP